MSKRDWTEPREKVDQEGCCRVCHRRPAEAAHIIPRSRVGPGQGENRFNILPLCRAHHQAFDALRLDVLPYLTHSEQAYAVGLVGMLEAIRRVTGLRELDRL